MGLGEVGLEPDRLADRRDGAGQVARLAQGEAEVAMGLGEIGPQADRFAVRGDGPREQRGRLRAAAPSLQVAAIAAQAAAVVGPAADQVTPDRLGLRRKPQSLSAGYRG
jgi:hypothetical protein